MRLTLAGGLAVLALGLSGPASAARAQAAPTATADNSRFAFAEALAFELQATGSAPITDIVLHYTIGDDATRNRRIPEFTAGTTVTATHRETLARGQIPPTTEIAWWWTLTDAAGQTTVTPPRRARYEDTRFTWHDTTVDGVVVWSYGDDAAAQALATKAAAALADLSATIGTTPDRPIHIVTYQSRQDMLGALVDRGGVFEERLSTLGARVAPDILLLLAGNDNPELDEVLRHELTHTVLHLHLAKEYLAAPAWLDEGLAMYEEGELDGSEAGRLAAAMRDDGLLSLRSLSSFPGEAELVPLAYAQSRDVIAFIVEAHGREGLHAVLDALATGRYNTDEALGVALGEDQLSLYQAYRAARGLGPAATPAPGTRAVRRQALDLDPFGVLALLALCGCLCLPLLALGAWLLTRAARRRPAPEAPLLLDQLPRE